MTNTEQPTSRTTHTVQELAAKLGVPWESVQAHSRELDGVIVGYQLRELRLANNVTQRELARRIGVSQNRISKIEKGEFPKTQLGTVQKYIEALGGTVSVDATFGDTVIPLRLG
jgi:DNA-binding XRE family transcriptional regulator